MPEYAPPGPQTAAAQSGNGRVRHPGVSSEDKGPGMLFLGERDLELLCDLFGHGAMLRSQIQRFYFPSLRRCNRRLKQLFEAGCVARAPLPLGPQMALWEGHMPHPEPAQPGMAAGFGAQFVYRLGGGAAALVARRLGWEVAEVRRLLRPGTPTFLAHTLECVNFRLTLQAVCAAQGVRLVRFLPERLARHAYEVRETRHPDAPWRQEVFKPDAFFELLTGHSGIAGASKAGPKTSCYFVEIDLGHTSSREFLTKLHIHRRYRETALFAQRYGAADFRTLVITTGRARQDHLRTLVEEAGEDLFWLTTFENVATEGPLSAIWHVPFRATPSGLTDA